MKTTYLFVILIMLASFFLVFYLDYSHMQEQILGKGDKNALELQTDANAQKDTSGVKQEEDMGIAKKPKDKGQDEKQIDPLAVKYYHIALEYLKKTPTFAYDGIPETITLVAYEKTAADEVLFKFRYYGKHPGYGDREGAPIPEEKTLHATLILIRNGDLNFAGTDNKYDEMTKQYLLFNPEIK